MKKNPGSLKGSGVEVKRYCRDNLPGTRSEPEKVKAKKPATERDRHVVLLKKTKRPQRLLCGPPGRFMGSQAHRR
jgi:hypothetical protein